MTRLYERPQSLDQALDLLPQEDWTILAGGTDIYPASAEAYAWGHPTPCHILDVTAINSLSSVEETPEAFRIGCLATWTELIEAELPNWFKALRFASQEIGGVQIQNRGTLVGNICNASPAADSVPALLVLDAAVELQAANETRTVPLDAFILGNRRTVRQPDELVTAIVIPKRGPSARSTFCKLGARRYLVISIAMVAVLIETDEADRIEHARVAVGACSEVAQRLPELEATLTGRAANIPLDDAFLEEALTVLTPIEDARSDAVYRQRAAQVLVSRALKEVGMA